MSYLQVIDKACGLDLAKHFHELKDFWPLNVTPYNL